MRGDRPPGSSPSVNSLIPSYARHLRAEGKSVGTVDHTYLPALERFDRFLEAQAMPRHVASVRREHIEAYIVALQREGKRPATVSLAYRSLQPFWRWCVEEDEIRTSPMARMTPPRVPEESPAVVSEDEIARLIKACGGKDVEARRDLALLRLLIDTGMRRGEIAGLSLDDLDLDGGRVAIAAERGKSRRTRTARFGARTARALDRYLGLRGQHPHHADPALWLGKRGAMTGSGILQVVARRGAQAHVGGLHPHLFRHTFAHMHLAAGGRRVVPCSRSARRGSPMALHDPGCCGVRGQRMLYNASGTGSGKHAAAAKA